MEGEWHQFAVDYGEYNPLMAGSIDGTDLRPHDRGVTRACQVNYRPNKQVIGIPERTLFIGRLHMDTNEDTLIKKFSKYGTIKNFNLVRDIATGRSKGYAFIEYKHFNDLKRAFEKSHHTIIDGYEIIVEFELERTLKGWKPRRLGGGFGGKKESGQLRFGGRERPFKKPIVIRRSANKHASFM